MMVRTLLAGLAAALALVAASPPAAADGFLHAEGTRIVDGEGRTVILRGMGLGGWMLQEGYMLQLGDLGKGQQHVIRRAIADLIGPAKTDAFYRAWLDNYITKADIDGMAADGFNSVRLPIHYNLLVDDKGRWREEGFARIDALIAWCKANRLYLILDLHAAPGGQGSDLPIADRDPATPSLWDSPAHRATTLALWTKLAKRYAGEPTVGAYDLLNEPNWDFDGEGGGHGCKDTASAPLWAFFRELTEAVRRVDTRHLLVIEGNCWGNNYAGLPPLWDGNIALSFHKYWNTTDRASIQPILTLRDARQVPVWLGESGENGNAWFRDAIRLVEGEGIGWAFWPLKKIGFNQPQEIVANPGWARLVAYWTKNGPRPVAAEAEATLIQLATHDILYANTVHHRDVVDAMLRQPHDDTTRPFAAISIGAGAARIAATDYDLGAPGFAYRDERAADYHVTTGGEPQAWNPGRTGRNDGVDIARDAAGVAYVTDFTGGEWLRYTVAAAAAGPRTVTLAGTGDADLTLTVNGREVAAPLNAPVTVPLLAGRNDLVVAVTDGTAELHAITIAPAR